MRDEAQDWLQTIPSTESKSFALLSAAFKETYCPSPELIWKECQQIWQKGQGADESVDAFVTRLRKGARRVNLNDSMLNFAIITGLRTPIRVHVLQQGVQSLKETLRAARIAETSLSADPITSLLMESLKSQTQENEKRAAQIDELSTKISTITAAALTPPTQAPIRQTPNLAEGNAQSAQQQYTASAGFDGRPANPPQQNYRQRKQTPQNQQRDNYGRSQQQQFEQPPAQYGGPPQGYAAPQQQQYPVQFTAPPTFVSQPPAFNGQPQFTQQPTPFNSQQP